MRGNLKKRTKLFRIVSIVSMALLAILLVTIVYFGSLPKKYDVSQGQISEFDINSTRSTKDSYETERRAIKASTEIDPIYIISDTVSAENTDIVHRFFEYCSELRKSNIDELGVIHNNKQELSNLLLSAVKERFNIVISGDVAYTLANISFVDFNYLENEAFSITSMLEMDALDAQSLMIEINNYCSLVKDTSTLNTNEYMSFSTLLNNVLGNLLKPNAVYDENATLSAKDAAYRNAVNDPVMIQKGSRIVSVGETITPHIYSQLKDLDLLPSSRFDVRLLVGIIVYIFIIFFAGAFYLSRYEHPYENGSKTLISLMIAFLVPIVSSRYLSSISPLFSTILFPTVIFSTYLGMQGGITLSCLSLMMVLPMSGFNTELIFVSVVSIYVCAVIAGQKNNKYNAAILIILSCVSSLIASLGYNLVTQSTTTDMFNSALWAVIGTGCSVVAAIGSQPIFELISNSASPMRLLDLAQQSHPLQRRLFLEAPGTSQHSMMVANLSDTAAEAIHANALLAKVGAYYHDIGKLERPEYFTENQSDGVNPHDNLPMEESIAIITSHPSDGIKLAKKHMLPMAIQNIILEHHGTTCPGYFYYKAKKEAEEKGLPPPDKTNFSYKGNVPSTKESAIVMIADSCEAAIRSRGVHDITEAEALCRSIIKSKIDEDQLVNSGLSFSDLEAIIEAFIQVYAGFFHERVKYPE